MWRWLKMNLGRILALLKRDNTIMNRSKWRIIEWIYFPVLSLFIWGFFSIFARQFAAQIAIMVLIIQIYFEFAQLAQATANQTMMEDVWRGTFRELMLTPLTSLEYLFSRIIHSGLRSMATLAILFVGAFTFFGANILVQNIFFFLMIAGLTYLASAAVSIIVSSLILTLGTEYGFLSWSSTQFLVLLSAPFFPITIFPLALQYVSYFMPYTWIFESIRQFVTSNTVCYTCLQYSAISNVAYIAISLPLFLYCFRRAIRTGALARFWR